MAQELVTDALREIIKPLLLEEKPEPKGGRARLQDQATLSGIIFLKSCNPWEVLVQGMGCGSGMTR
jgi:transposase